MRDWVDDLALRLADTSLSRREVGRLTLFGVASAAVTRVFGASQPAAAPDNGLPPGSPCPPPIRDGQPCGPIPCPFNGTHLVWVGNGSCLIHPAFAPKVSAIDSCAA